ncbi:6-phosphofructokinase [Egibacter rhizosphaerae]|uniref:6-phosphofructokinase n=1 Tax=Egibacter rhizosphaerae TaxID=1670831 RepID=UPI00197A7C81|nr:ATP-dependent 6-phosphofructokinase [Egibacter rhizosphaerae]
MTERIGVLTGGGDCPGLNAAIRAVVRHGLESHKLRVHGFRNGWRGPLDVTAQTLTLESTRGLLHLGGTFLGTSRTDPIAEPDGVARIHEALEVYELDGFIVIGGEGTLSAANTLAAEHGVPIIGIPKTIDNDLGGTDYTIGFATALDIATDAVDRLHSTAESHNRVMLLEVMGRNAGWIATHAGIAGGADSILIPEHPFDVHQVCRHLKRRHGSGRSFSIVVVAEGAVPADDTLNLTDYELDQFGRPVLGGIASSLRPIIEAQTGFATRETILGHVQRGGTPNPFDRVLATRMGVRAVDLAVAGEWGQMVGLVGGEVKPVPLAEATRSLRRVPEDHYRAAEVFFG